MVTFSFVSCRTRLGHCSGYGCLALRSAHVFFLFVAWLHSILFGCVRAFVRLFFYYDSPKLSGLPQSVWFADQTFNHSSILWDSSSCRYVPSGLVIAANFTPVNTYIGCSPESHSWYQGLEKLAQRGILGDFLLAPMCPIDKVALWESLLHLMCVCVYVCMCVCVYVCMCVCVYVCMCVDNNILLICMVYGDLSPYPFTYISSVIYLRGE